MTELECRIGYAFRDPSLLVRALTTPACRMDHPEGGDNQRLEFLGDAVLGLLSADAGEILVGGSDIVKMGDAAATKFRRRHIGVVFQAFNLLNEKTVRENIVLPLRLDGAKVDEGRLASLVSSLGIADILSKKPEELSGGERQRVAIARALIASPDVVLADEPTGNLDAKASKAICSLLRDLNGKEKSAILVVTHDPQVAATESKVHFLKDGRIVASHDTHGDPELISKLYLETYRA